MNRKTTKQEPKEKPYNFNDGGKYSLYFLAYDGEAQEEPFKFDSLAEAWDHIEKIGSKWIFCPLPFICSGGIIEGPPRGLSILLGEKLETAKKLISQVSKKVKEAEAEPDPELLGWEIKKILFPEEPGEDYPELYKIAQDIAREAGDQINQRAQGVKSDCKYKAQFILEKVVKILEEAV